MDFGAAPPARAGDGLRRARAHRDRLKAWLVDCAYPLWWCAGADQRGGGFHEKLDQTGRPLPSARRARTGRPQPPLGPIRSAVPLKGSGFI